MVTSRTKKQLIVFVIITVLGVAFVGAKYARLNRLFYDDAYAVSAKFTDSGGIFKGAEVTYRGVRVGQVSALDLTRSGVDVVMSIDKSNDKIPAKTLAVVGNKSAVGEQYIELQPKTDSGPFLKNGSTVGYQDTEIPVSTTTLLTNLDQLVNSVPQDDLRTVVSQFGAAFKDAGPSLTQIVDTSNAFIKAADENFNTTSALIDDSNTVLQTQVDKTSAIKSFSRDLSLFSGTLAGSDSDLRRVIDNGSATAQELRVFLQQNQVELGSLINNLVTTGQITVAHLKGIRQILVLYPYIVEGAYSVVGQANKGGPYDANFGVVLTQASPVCENGYPVKDRRPATDTKDLPMDTGAGCTDGPGGSDPRGAQNAPNGRAGTAYRAPAGPSYQAPVIGTYDHSTGKMSWADQASSQPKITYAGGAQRTFGKDSWKWLLLQPVTEE